MSLVIKDKHTINFEYLYMLCFSLVVTIMYLSNGVVPKFILTYANVACFFCVLPLIIKIIHDCNNLGRSLLVVVLSVISIIVGFNSEDFTIPVDIILILGAKNINFINIMKVFFYIGTFITCGYFVASILNIMPNFAYQPSGATHLMSRYCFGFNYPVKFSESILILCVVYSIIHINRISWFRIFIFIFLTYFILKYNDTRMDYYCMIILIVITVIRKTFPKLLNKIPLTLSWLSLPIMTFISFCFAIFYNYFASNSLLYNQINKSLENRFFSSYYWLSSLKFTLFGQSMTQYNYYFSFNGNSIHGYIDQSMIRIFVLYGFIILILFLCAYTYKMFKLYKLNMNFYVLLFLVVVVRGFFDVNLIQIIGNPFLVILFANVCMNKKRTNSTYKRDINKLRVKS